MNYSMLCSECQLQILDETNMVKWWFSASFLDDGKLLYPLLESINGPGRPWDKLVVSYGTEEKKKEMPYIRLQSCVHLLCVSSMNHKKTFCRTNM